MSALRVGLDLDGCIYGDNWLNGMRRRCAEFRGVPIESLPWPTSWVFAETWGFTSVEFDGIMEDAHETGIFIEGEPDPDGVKMMDALFELGVEMHIVTHRPCTRSVLRDTFMWVAKYELPASSVTLTGKKDAVETDIFLDDGMHVVEALEEVGETIPVLFTTPQNENADWAGLRADSFLDFTFMVLTARQALLDEGDDIDEFERQVTIADALDSFLE